jgi:hypothetical protein
VFDFNGLSCSERDDAADRIVWRDTHCHSIAGDDLDTEAAHPAAQLRQHFVPRITLDAVKPSGVHRNDCPLHVYKIVFAQQLILSRS